MKKSIKYKRFHMINYKNKDFFKIVDKAMWGLRVRKACVLTRKHFEACVKVFKYYGRISHCKVIYWFYVFPTFGLTKKPKDCRMGRGKGKVVHLIALAKAGKIVLEFDHDSELIAEKILRRCSFILPVNSYSCLRELW